MTAGPQDRLELHRRGRRPGRDGRARRLLRAGRRASRARRARGAGRHPRDGPRRDAAAGHGREPQRRLGRHERLRRPPGHAGHRHRRPARRGQGDRHPGHPAAGLGRAQRRGPAGLGDARRHPGAPVGVHVRPERPGRARGAQRRRPGDDRARRPRHGARAGRRPRPARARRRPADGAVRAVAPQRPQRAGRRVGRPRARHRPRRRRRGAAHVPPRRRPQPRPDEHLHRCPSRAARSPSSSTSRTTRPASRPCSTSRAGSRRPAARVHLALGTAGDRTDDILQALGEIAGLRADHVVAAHKDHYLRGRTADGPRGASCGSGWPAPASATSRPTPPSSPASRRASRRPRTATSSALMCHAERAEIVAWLRSRGARRPTTPTPSAARSCRARGEHEARGRDRRALGDRRMPRRGVERGRRGCTPPIPATPGSPTSTPAPTTAPGTRRMPCRSTRRPCRLGLREPLRHRAQLQLASSLRNLGRHDEAPRRRRRRRRAASREPGRRGVPRPRARTTPVSPTQALRDLLAPSWRRARTRTSCATAGRSRPTPPSSAAEPGPRRASACSAAGLEVAGGGVAGLRGLLLEGRRGRGRGRRPSRWVCVPGWACLRHRLELGHDRGVLVDARARRCRRGWRGP